MASFKHFFFRFIFIALCFRFHLLLFGFFGAFYVRGYFVENWLACLLYIKFACSREKNSVKNKCEESQENNVITFI